MSRIKLATRKRFTLHEIALLLVRFDHIDDRIVNANHDIMRQAAPDKIHSSGRAHTNLLECPMGLW